jgi:hypothetical protein
MVGVELGEAILILFRPLPGSNVTHSVIKTKMGLIICTLMQNRQKIFKFKPKIFQKLNYSG